MDKAAALLEKCLAHSGASFRIGITGSPGVGKSTFIENWGLWLIENNFNPAVLAVDPSSTISKGSLLGDKTRMESLSKNDRAYIRPSPARETLGGVAHATKESIILCEAAGFNPILIETVGVGQSETFVRQMVDFFLLLIAPGSGDDLQGIKRGIVELADLICINKADGERKKIAQQTQSDFKNALHLFSRDEKGWKPEVIRCSGLEGIGLSTIWEKVDEYFKFMQKEERLSNLRKRQNQFWLDFQLRKFLEGFILKNDAVAQMLVDEKKAIKKEKQSVTGALLRLKQKVVDLFETEQ
jgi:LAO/AO transport system kinase